METAVCYDIKGDILLSRMIVNWIHVQSRLGQALRLLRPWLDLNLSVVIKSRNLNEIFAYTASVPHPVQYYWWEPWPDI